MSNLYQSLSHSKWDCKYHVVFIPKRRRKVLFGRVRQHLGEIFHALARQKECQIIEGHLRPDHVHMCIAIPPKYPVASVIGFLKGRVRLPWLDCAAASRTSRASICGLVDTRFRRSGSNWSKFANTSETRRKRMEQDVSSVIAQRRALARRRNHLGNRL